jgi:hypothetical protein
MTNQGVLNRPDAPSSGEQHQLRQQAGRARALYDAMLALPSDASEHRRDVWSEIVEIQNHITLLIEG